MRARGARRERTPHLPQRVPLLQRGSATRRNIRRGDVRDLLTHRDGAERKRIFSEERRGRRISYMAGRRGLYTSALLRDPSPARPHPAKYKSASRSSRARSMQISAESARRPAPRAHAGNRRTTITAARRVCRAALCISGRAYYPVWARCTQRVRLLSLWSAHPWSGPLLHRLAPSGRRLRAGIAIGSVVPSVSSSASGGPCR